MGLNMSSIYVRELMCEMYCERITIFPFIVIFVQILDLSLWKVLEEIDIIIFGKSMSYETKNIIFSLSTCESMLQLRPSIILSFEVICICASDPPQVLQRKSNMPNEILQFSPRQQMHIRKILESLLLKVASHIEALGKLGHSNHEVYMFFL